MSPNHPRPVPSPDAIRAAIREGRYHDALGVPPSASVIEIDVAAFQLGDKYPELASEISGIVQILNVPEKREVYDIACGLRDRALAELVRRFWSDIRDPRRSCMWWAWNSVQKYLRCDGAKGDVLVGRIAATSLAKYALPWVVEEVIGGACPADAFTLVERASGRAVRTYLFKSCPACEQTRTQVCAACRGRGRVGEVAEVINLVPDFAGLYEALLAKCPACEGRGRIPCDCEDSYTFHIPAGAKAGDVVIGLGQRTRRRAYVTLDHAVYTPRPSYALTYLYRMSAWARRRGDPDSEATLEDGLWAATVGRLAGVVVFGLLACGLGALVGVGFGATWWGVAAGVTSALPLLSLLLWQPQFDARDRWRLVFWAACILLSLLTVVGVGWLIGRLLLGSAVWGIMAVLQVGFWQVARVFEVNTR